jgi:hypothetical protein
MVGWSSAVPVGGVMLRLTAEQAFDVVASAADEYGPPPPHKRVMPDCLL